MNRWLPLNVKIPDDHFALTKSFDSSIARRTRLITSQIQIQMNGHD